MFVSTILLCPIHLIMQNELLYYIGTPSRSREDKDACDNSQTCTYSTLVSPKVPTIPLVLFGIASSTEHVVLWVQARAETPINNQPFQSYLWPHHRPLHPPNAFRAPFSSADCFLPMRAPHGAVQLLAGIQHEIGQTRTLLEEV
jgi:hypothetical protein